MALDSSSEIEWRNDEEYVWYVGYGSNLCQERFLCYILGGQFKWGGQEAKGCEDRTPPVANAPITIPLDLYFAGRSKSWQNGEVAFVSTQQRDGRAGHTYARMWKITMNQFECVWKQEGSLYFRRLPLGRHSDGVPVVTVTGREGLPVTRPSDEYLRTIALGLEEAYNLSKKGIVEYLSGTPGVKGRLSEARIAAIIDSAR